MSLLLGNIQTNVHVFNPLDVLDLVQLVLLSVFFFKKILLSVKEQRNAKVPGLFVFYQQRR